NAAGGISTGRCYQYEYVVYDNVGNATTYASSDIKVDTSGPSVPSLSLSSASGNTFINGGTVYINAQAGKSGSFQAAATSTDNDSGILKLNFPSLTGFSSGGGDTASSPYQTTYNWTGAVAASGSQTITSYNNSSLTNSNPFTVTPDTSNPSGGDLTATPISQTLTGPNCYLYTLTGADNVGNTTSISTLVKVDTTGPSAPSVSLSSASGNTFVSGTTAYINAQAGKSGSFQAAATSTDN